jgi:hypothetical protein
VRLTIAEACEKLEDDPFFKCKRIGVTTFVGNRLSIEVVLRGERRIRGGIQPCFSEFRDEVFVDVDAWRRLGTAVRNSTTLHSIELKRYRYVIDRDLLVAAAQCFNAFMAEVKHNKSIKLASFHLTGAPMDHLSHFIQDNGALKILLLESSEGVSLEQSAVLSTAISSAQLEKVKIWDCRFESVGAFERMLEGCSKVEELQVRCRNNSEFTAVAAFIGDPANVLRKLDIDLEHNLGIQDEAVRNIAASLRDNTHLKELKFHEVDVRTLRSYGNTHFDRLLCDASSIDSIVNSNHVLEVIYHERREFSPFTEQCMLLNRNPDKNKVIRDKILGFYCVGEFSVSPFSGMAVSVLPKVLSQFGGNCNLSAIYRLLQCIPDLCNVSDRESCEQHDSKRLKMSSVSSVPDS